VRRQRPSSRVFLIGVRISVFAGVSLAARRLGLLVQATGADPEEEGGACLRQSGAAKRSRLCASPRKRGCRFIARPAQYDLVAILAADPDTPTVAERVGRKGAGVTSRPTIKSQCFQMLHNDSMTQASRIGSVNCR
jgi:hypothetical protein